MSTFTVEIKAAPELLLLLHGLVAAIERLAPAVGQAAEQAPPPLIPPSEPVMPDEASDVAPDEAAAETTSQPAPLVRWTDERKTLMWHNIDEPDFPDMLQRLNALPGLDITMVMLKSQRNNFIIRRKRGLGIPAKSLSARPATLRSDARISRCRPVQTAPSAALPLPAARTAEPSVAAIQLADDARTTIDVAEIDWRGAMDWAQRNDVDISGDDDDVLRAANRRRRELRLPRFRIIASRGRPEGLASVTAQMRP